MIEQCFENFTGESFMALIGREGPIEAASRLIIKFDKTLKAKNIRYLRYKYCNDPVGHGDDVTQETWISAIDDIVRFHDGAKKVKYTNPVGWLYRIGRNICDGHIRDCKFKYLVNDLADARSHVVQEPPTLKFSNILPFANSPIESAFYKDELFHLIRQAFYTLKPDQRVALTFHLNEYSHKEIASFMKISDTNARQLVCRGIREIKLYIKKVAGEN